MTEARLVTKEQLVAALVAELHELPRVPVTTEAGLPLVAHYIEDCETWVREHKDAIFAALPAAAPAEGLREAAMLRDAASIALLSRDTSGDPPVDAFAALEPLRHALTEYDRAALARPESASVVEYGQCGSLDWTVEKWGRVTHKQSCPNRTDPFCQTHPEGCPE